MKLLSDAPTRRLLNRLSRGGRFAWMELLALTLLALQLARLVWAGVTPIGPYGDWQGTPLAVTPPAQRGALFASLDPFFRGQVETVAAVTTVTPLNVTLFGTTTNVATGGGSAIIAGEDGVQQSYVVGEEIAPGARLVGVAFDSAIVERNGQREVLYLDQDRAAVAAEASAAANAAPAAGTPAPSTGITVTPAPPPPPPPPPPAPPGTPQATMTPTSLRAGVGFAPRVAGGRVSGVAVSPQGDGRVFAQAGLRSGDVIRSVNGQQIRSAADLARLQGQLTPGARLSLGVERGAEVATVALTLAGQ